MNKLIEVVDSFYDAMMFGIPFIGGTLGVLTVIGFIQWNL
jgi:hypothetical protein